MAIDSIGFNLPTSFGMDSSPLGGLDLGSGLDLGGLGGLGTNPMGDLFADSPTSPLSTDSFVPTGEQLAQGMENFPDFFSAFQSEQRFGRFATEPEPPPGLDVRRFEEFPDSGLDIPD